MRVIEPYDEEGFPTEELNAANQNGASMSTTETKGANMKAWNFPKECLAWIHDNSSQCCLPRGHAGAHEDVTGKQETETTMQVMIDTRNLRIVRVDEMAIGIRDLEFIVRAVNSHADMLEALEELIAGAKYAYDNGSYPKNWYEVMDNAEAVVAKAKGGTA